MPLKILSARESPVLTTASYFLIGMSGALVIGLKPILLSLYVNHASISQVDAGYMISAEVLAAVIGTLWVAFRVPWWGQQRQLSAALLVLICGNLLAAIADGAIQLLMARILAGLGAGFTTGIFAAAMAGSANPGRRFGLFTILLLLIAAAAFSLAPQAIEMAGMAGLFLMLCILPVLAWVFLLCTSPKSLSAARQVTPPRAVENTSSGPLTALKSSSGVFLAVGALAYYLAVGGVWPYMGQIGLAAKLTPDQIAQVFGVSQLWGALGAIVPMAVGSRIGRIKPIIFALGIGILSMSAIFLWLEQARVFIMASQAFMFGWLMFFPYLMGLSACLDTEGGFSSLVYTIQNIGFFVGPALCAQAVSIGGYDALLLFGIASMTVALVCLSVSVLKLRRRPAFA